MRATKAKILKATKKPLLFGRFCCILMGMGDDPLAQRATHAMLPLQPFDCPELSADQETAMAQDLADQFNAYVGEHLVDTLADLARDVLETNSIDPESPLAYDLVQDLINRIVVTAK